MFLFLCSARKGWFGQIVFRVLFSWIIFQCSFQNFVDFYSVFVIRYYEWEYSPLLFWLGVSKEGICL